MSAVAGGSRTYFGGRTGASAVAVGAELTDEQRAELTEGLKELARAMVLLAMTAFGLLVVALELLAHA